MAEWLRSGLQSRLHRFDSGRRLTCKSAHSGVCQSSGCTPSVPRESLVGVLTALSDGILLAVKNDGERNAEGRDPQPEIDQSGADRDRIAEGRDRRAESHDLESDARDERATARDERAEAREEAAAQVDAGPAADRKGALRDRQGSASDRTQSADDRKASGADRVASARERAAYALDDVTGAYRREPGVVVLERETGKAKRTMQPFTLTFVDVDGLKQTNDSLGHAAGDQLLRNVADSIRAHLRSDDLMIRFGGDEFLCALPDVPMPEAIEQFRLVKKDLSANHQASITVGHAELDRDDALEDLIARADERMYRERQERGAGA